jgi:hypothetical protein
MQRADAMAAVRIPFEEMGRQNYFQLIDQDRQRALQEAHDAARSRLVGKSTEYRPIDSPEELHGSSNHEAPEAHGEAQLDAHHSTGSNVHNASSEVEDPDAVHEDMQAVVAMMDETPSDTMPLAIMTYDLSTVEAVSDPRDFFEECRVLEQ